MILINGKSELPELSGKGTVRLGEEGAPHSIRHASGNLGGLGRNDLGVRDLFFYQVNKTNPQAADILIQRSRYTMKQSGEKLK